MNNCTEETTKAGQIIIWTESQDLGARLGLRFTPGERLQLYTHTLVAGSHDDYVKLFCTTEGMVITSKILCPRLLQYASEHYPKEFRRMPEPVPAEA